MMELQNLLKSVSDGLKTLAKGVEAIAEKVDEATRSQGPVMSKRKKPPTATKAKAVKRSVKKVSKRKIATQATASETVMKIIGRSKKGVSSAAIMEKTGYDRKKVANVIYRLGKQGKIKSVQKGVYIKT
jgi:hypothetical protein